jgi:hypothetical protein
MVSSHRLTLVLAFTLGFWASRNASAQVEHRWSADVTVGGATVNSGEFLNEIGKAVAHLAIANRVLQGGRFTAYAEAGYDWLGKAGPIGANSDLVCIVDRPGGGCRPDFPDVTGPSASIGLLYAPFTRVETRVGVGGAAYSVDGTRVGAVVGQLDAAVFPAADFGLILGSRFAVIPRYRHDRLTMVPLLLGLRVR